ncbi:hypothetical protein ACTOB_003479 [Actinoplanes oblitus]|uniref:PH domain-containing protein n=1 Tax=Actinoplanes oblitus TaxID=3040509 RepID=A0ABY8WPI3_9ACTN|nr:hypothetical protein [Actinoplanes oblitus]WIM99814.1 hypothetical protein ACTOB_003479 [Actinoplanes oblitus]
MIKMMPYRSLGPGDVTAPISDAMLFRHSVLRALFILVPVMIVAWALSMMLASTLLGHPVGWGIHDFLPPPLVGMAVGFGVGALRQRRRPTWIRVSSLGIELAQRGDPVFVPWSSITAARVRRRWIFAVLEVIPADLHAVKAVLPSPYLPRVWYKRGVAMFRIEVGMIRPGLRDLRAALVQYRHAPEEFALNQTAV